MATITINVEANPILACNSSFSVSGDIGIYEMDINYGSDIGYAGIQYNAQQIPDRFQLYWDNVLVADSKYVGNNLTGMPPNTPGLQGNKSLQVKVYDGTSFNNTGEIRDITITQDDIANGTTEPTAGLGLIYFNKTSASPNIVKLIVTGPLTSTSWQLPVIICPQEDIPTL